VSVRAFLGPIVNVSTTLPVRQKFRTKKVLPKHNHNTFMKPTMHCYKLISNFPQTFLQQTAAHISTTDTDRFHHRIGVRERFRVGPLNVIISRSSCRNRLQRFPVAAVYNHSTISNTGARHDLRPYNYYHYCSVDHRRTFTWTRLRPKTYIKL